LFYINIIAVLLSIFSKKTSECSPGLHLAPRSPYRNYWPPKLPKMMARL